MIGVVMNAKQANECQKRGCRTLVQEAGHEFCKMHECVSLKCKKVRVSSSSFCLAHKCKVKNCMAPHIAHRKYCHNHRRLEA